MIKSKPIPPGRECNHTCCSNTCHREPKPPKPRTPLKRTPIKRKPFIAGDKNEELEAWFEMVAEEIAKNPVCWECNSFIPHYNKCGCGLYSDSLEPRCDECKSFPKLDYYRCASAHILDKRKAQFPSVSCHPSNFLILGSGCGCHQKFDRSWDDRMKMKVWPIAIERIRQIYPYIATNELYRLPTIVLEELGKGEGSPFE